MVIKRKGQRGLGLNEPLRHPDHRRPVTRREFLAQGFITGAATVVATPLLAALLSPRANAALSDQVLQDLDPNGLCNITLGAGKIPFICFDLAGGANISGSNVLVGQQGGQLDFLTTAGYSILGLPGNMTPNTSTTGSFVDTSMGLAFHSDSAFLRGIKSRASAATLANTNGSVIPALSQNDTQNNPHNPMYGIAKAGAKGALLTLIGSENSDSGGNSMAPLGMIDPSIRPTTIDVPSDASGLVNTGQLGTLLGSASDTAAVMESISRISKAKLDAINTKVAADAQIKQNAQCSYVRSAYQAAAFPSPAVLDPSQDTRIVGPSGIFTAAEFSGDSSFKKTATVSKLVIDGMAGAGTIEMGGNDYHTGDRMTGEARDFESGQCMGACLEYAARAGKPLMLYVFSDGSLSSNGMIDNSVGGRGKGVWTNDNQAVASVFFLVYNPSGRASFFNSAQSAAMGGVQIGNFTSGGNVNSMGSPGANSVTSLVDMILLNYMALHGQQNQFQATFPTSALNATSLTNLIAFNPIVNGKIGA